MFDAAYLGDLYESLDNFLEVYILVQVFLVLCNFSLEVPYEFLVLDM